MKIKITKAIARERKRRSILSAKNSLKEAKERLKRVEEEPLEEEVEKIQLSDDHLGRLGVSCHKLNTNTTWSDLSYQTVYDNMQIMRTHQLFTAETYAFYERLNAPTLSFASTVGAGQTD